MTSPAPMVSDSPSTAVVSPYLITRSVTSTAGVVTRGSLKFGAPQGRTGGRARDQTRVGTQPVQAVAESELTG